ncbi:PTS sugar transporter subunit IIA [Streptomyces flavofungini]|uniref:PTS sugar transporter subunit IIA n=1 Tax=Streptomyces flavofungini TaxID=68200 RepID=UPI0025B21A3B|nr:PTS sugar transporter subunit IIA [Streptomyces flavofungini]WJV50396.1 PTS sugar transporter subunit IIA [Streptomyces flavofungini]
MVAVSDLLPVEAIRLDVVAEDWRAAIRAAGDLLVATGSGTDAYTAEMIRTVEDSGPYIVLAPGLAFAHARPSPAVLRTGMAWVRLARPVEFGHETNDPVGLVVALAAKDATAHTDAMASLARLLADPETAEALRVAPTPTAVRVILAGETGETGAGEAAGAAPGAGAGAGAGAGVGAGAGLGAGAEAAAAAPASASAAGPAVHKILTVCGNGLGTSLFLKNTLEQVLDRWGWSRYVSVEATDTISAKGKASEAVAILTSREIAKTLGDVGVPVRVVDDFTSTTEADRVLRDTYDV